MAWENRYPNQRGYGQQGGYGRSYGQNGGQLRTQGETAAEIKPLPIPEDYVDDVYNVESLRTEPELSAESKLKLMRLRVRMVYDAGRERDVKDFVEQAKLLEYLKGVGDSREAMIQFAHYVEALVAYHRYLGGRDN